VLYLRHEADPRIITVSVEYFLAKVVALARLKRKSGHEGDEAETQELGLMVRWGKCECGSSRCIV
jgi:hypothetical protein